MKRIFQLTASAIAFLVACGASFALIMFLSGGKYPQKLDFDVPRELSDRVLDLELGLLPVLVGLLAAQGLIRFFGLSAVTNEITDSIKPAIVVFTGYARFVLILISATYIILGSMWSGLAHLILAILAFAHFFRSERAKEAALRPAVLSEDEEEGEDSPKHG